MRRKFLSVVLCVCMMLTMVPFAFAAEGDKVAKVGSQEYTSLQEAVNAVGSDNGSTVTLLNDVALNSTLVLNNSLTLDLNGHKISNGSSLSGYLMKIEHPSKVSIVGNQKNSSIVDTRNNATGTITAICVFGELTVSGSNLTISRGANGIAVKVDEQSPNQGKLTVNSGTISVDVATTTSSQAIQNWGTTIINGGTFNGDVDSYSYNNIAGNMTINDGTFNGDVYATQMKYTTYNYDWPTASAQIEIKNGNFNKTVFECYVVDSAGLQPIQSVTKPDGVTESEVSVSGGTFSANPTAYLVADYSAKDSNSKYLVVPTKADNAVAQIDTTYYNTLADAVADASITSTDTIKLLKDTTERLTLNNGKDITLDLDGHTLSYANQTVSVRHGKLTVNGPGTIKENSPYLGAILIKGSTNQEDTNYSVVNVNGDVTLSGWAPVFVDQNSEKAYGVTVNLNGATLKAQKDTGGDDGVGLYVNGSIKDTVNAPVIKLENTTIDAQGEGMYLAGYADTTIKGGSIVGTQTGIEIRAGKLAVNDVIVTGNGTPTTVTPNGNGSTADGVGIAVMQHTSKLPIEVTISDGTISGYTGLLEANPQKNSAADIAKVNIKVTGGKFSAINGGTNSISSDDKTGFITGGLFSSDPTPYCGKTEGEDNKQLAGIENTNSATKAQYPFTVGILDLATDVDVAPAAPATKAETTGKDQNVVPVMNSAATAAAGTTATGLDAIGGNEATKVTTSEVNEAKARLSQTEGVTVGDQTVTLYVQPYLDITVTDADVTTSSEGAASTINSLSLNIIPMVKKVASTATSAENIELNPGNETGKTKNATVISTTEVKNVNTPVTITLPLPSGFASSTTDKLSIKHTKANGSVEYYTGTVTSAATGQGEDAVTTYYVTFTTNGFSPFVIYAASANVASIGDGANQKVYPTLQAAIDAVQNNETITLLKDTNENVTVSKAIKFTLAGGKDYLKGSIAAGSRYSMTTSEANGKTEYTFTYVGGGSSSSISTPTTYAVNVNAATNGAVAADKKTASKGTTVTVTASPSKGYVVDAVKVVDKDGKDVAVTEKDGKYVFTMPASAVTVTGSFKAETPAPVALPFTDVKSGNWFYDAVKYAYAQGLMTGTSATTFAPNGTMNRAMIVTVLYRLEKSPAVTGASKFTDVPAGQWYSDAVAWAAANKIVNGYDETTFGPMNAVTREQMAAILFRYEQVKGLENVTLEENLNRFPDQNKISAYAIPALQWAVGQKIINGNADGTLDPTGTATRAQVAQIFTNLLNQ